MNARCPWCHDWNPYAPANHGASHTICRHCQKRMWMEIDERIEATPPLGSDRGLFDRFLDFIRRCDRSR